MAPRKLTIDDYEITRDGQVINKTNGHVLKPQPNGKGYLRVSIGKQLMFVHRLVAEKYIPNPDNKSQVNHIDGNKLNNTVENLEWVTNQENRTHAVETSLHFSGEQCQNHILTEEDIKYIKQNAGTKTNKEWADIYGVSPRTISDVVNYKTWKQVK